MIINSWHVLHQLRTRRRSWPWQQHIHSIGTRLFTTYWGAFVRWIAFVLSMAACQAVWVRVQGLIISNNSVTPHYIQHCMDLQLAVDPYKRRVLFESMDWLSKSHIVSWHISANQVSTKHSPTAVVWYEHGLKKCIFPDKEVRFPTISYVFLYLRSQSFPPNG